ncbi:MAG: tyrosine-type recombinase/integrase [Planctomycetota bacterium]
MASRKQPVNDPKPRLHKGTGQLVVTLRDSNTGRRKDFYCGLYGKAESMVRYAEVVQAWKDRGRVLDAIPTAPAPPADSPGQGTVASIALAYLNDLLAQGRMHEKHLSGLKRALGILRSIHGATPITDFGPKALKEVRKAMIDYRTGKKKDRPWCRKTINERVRHLVNMAEWAVSEERAPAHWAHALQSVKPLKRGEFSVPEGEPVKPAVIEHVEAIREHVSSVVWAMVQVQRYSGMRAGEVCIMRLTDIDITGDIWLYRPTAHKNQHRGHDRVVALGKKAQDAIRPLLTDRAIHAYLFDPRESFRQRAEANATEGKSRRANQKRSPTKTDRTLNDHYTTATYYRAIQRGCKLANVQPWGTHRLRHLFATEARKELGPEHAQAVLGDKSIKMVERYAEISTQRAIEAARKIG